MTAPEAESVLVARAAAGDASAFAQLVEPCRTQTWAVCYRITGHREDAEDALQDALIAAWRSIGGFRGGSKFSTWLYRIATNAALAVAQKRRDVPVAEIFESTESAGAEPAGDSPFDTGVVERDAIAQALEKLPPDFRTALVLREWGDLSYADIAEAQGVGVQTVKSRINRARRALAELLTAA